MVRRGSCLLNTGRRNKIYNRRKILMWARASDGSAKTKLHLVTSPSRQRSLRIEFQFATITTTKMTCMMTIALIALSGETMRLFDWYSKIPRTLWQLRPARAARLVSPMQEIPLKISGSKNYIRLCAKCISTSQKSLTARQHFGNSFTAKSSYRQLSRRWLTNCTQQYSARTMFLAVTLNKVNSCQRMHKRRAHSSHLQIVVLGPT